MASNIDNIYQPYISFHFVQGITEVRVKRSTPYTDVDIRKCGHSFQISSLHHNTLRVELSEEYQGLLDEAYQI